MKMSGTFQVLQSGVNDRICTLEISTDEFMNKVNPNFEPVTARSIIHLQVQSEAGMAMV